MAEEYKWLTTNRTGHCVLCNAETHSGDRVLWSLIDKSRIWCKTCAEKLGASDSSGGGQGNPTGGVVGGGVVTTATHSNSTPSSSSKQVVVDMKMCDTCRAMVERSTLTHVLRVVGAESGIYICERCHWLYDAQWGLKVHGMWRPTPKPIAEAKA